MLILPDEAQFAGVVKWERFGWEDHDSWNGNLRRTQTTKYLSFELSLGLGLIACFVNDPRASEVLAGLLDWESMPGTSKSWIFNRCKQSLKIQQKTIALFLCTVKNSRRYNKCQHFPPSSPIDL